MPIYEYKCLRCGAVFEKLIHFFEEEKPCCPACDSKEIEKLVSPVSQQSEGEYSSPSWDYTCGTTRSFG